MTRRALPMLVLLALLLLTLAACGGGSDESATTSSTATTSAGGGGGGSTVKVAADPSGALKFDTTSLEATAGKVTIDFTNDSSISHDVKIEGNGVSGEGTDEVSGGSTSATVDLQAGTYTFYCSVDGHRAAGMEGTLVVK
jgi:plastocyanin